MGQLRPPLPGKGLHVPSAILASNPEIPERDTMLFYLLLLMAASATGPRLLGVSRRPQLPGGTMSPYFLGH